MPEITYKEFKTHLIDIQKRAKNAPMQAYLIYGEELLCKKTFEALIDALLPGDGKRHNLESVDGAKESVFDAINTLNTYSLMAGPKVVVVPESRIFDGQQNHVKLLEKVKEAYLKNNAKKAGHYFKSLLDQLQLTVEDISTKDAMEQLIPRGEKESAYDWLRSALDNGIADGIQTTSGTQPEEALQNALEKGFPRGNYLVMATDLVDKRRRLFKTFKTQGLIVNCSVPKGGRKADRVVQEEVLREQMQVILQKHQKTMDHKAFLHLYALTGFDLRTFSNNLEKLVLYTGDRPQITIDDIEKNLSRTKQDPIYEFTNALSDQNLEQAVFFLSSLLSADIHPLQIISAMTNHFRKVLLAKSFTVSQFGQHWRQGITFQAFRSDILPAIQEYDQLQIECQEEWHAVSSSANGKAQGTSKKGSPKQRSKKKAKRATDLMVAATPANPYPIYQMLKKSDHFAMEQLFDFFALFNAADVKLKRSAQSPKMILEALIFYICATENKK